MRQLPATVGARQALSLDVQGPLSLKSPESRGRECDVDEEYDRFSVMGLVDRVVTVVRCTTFGDGVKEGWWYWC